MTYEEAKKYAKRLGESNLWIFEHDGKFEVIRGFAYLHYLDLDGWVPRAKLVLMPVITEV